MSDTTAICRNCKEELSLDDFYKQKNGNRQSWCKRCLCTKVRVKTPDQAWRWSLPGRHGITGDQYNEILKSQGGGCAICGTTPEENGKRLSVDHDHSCCDSKTSCGGCVRGLLCDRHNLGLGKFRDSVDDLSRAIEYLGSRV